MIECKSTCRMEPLNQILLLLVMMVVLVLEEGRWCHGCLEQERDALLQIKASFNNHINTTWPPYPFYYYSPFDQQMNTPWEVDSNCCNWKMVECNNITGRVNKLYLWDVRAYLNLGEMYLNASLFLPFKELKELSLSGNQISGCIENEGFGILSKLFKLEFLDLSENNFNDTVLSSLKRLSSLKYLDLAYNRLKGSFDFKELEGLSNLQELRLSRNEITRFMAPTDDHSLRNLSVLVLNYIAINGRKLQLQSLEALPNLKTLHLESNNFEGAIFGPDLQNFTNLEELFLDGSSLDKSSFESLGVLPSLKRLSLRQINGTQGFPSLKKLEFLDLSFSTVKNSFLQTVGMWTSLKTLLLDYCNLIGRLPTFQGLCELKHLQTLRLSNNDLTGPLPFCFSNLSSLEVLDVSSNHFNGNISLSPISSLTSIRYLLISNNDFQVPFSLGSFSNHSKLKTLGAQNNEIFLESDYVLNLTVKFQLESLSLSSHNRLHVEGFPEFLRHQHDLKFVDLSHVKIEGSGFPSWLLENNVNLEELYLVDNSLSGLLQFPNLSVMHLSRLDISGNSFHGHIPAEIGTTFESLGFLNMSRNAFNGNIPSSVGKMKWLWNLDLSNNRLSGRIPESLTMGCSSLYILMLSNNSLQGPIFQKSFNLQQLGRLLLNDNQFTGGIPDSLSNSSLTTLDVSNNHLHGGIPMWMMNLSSLDVLDLSNNHFSGMLPSNFCPPSLTEVYLSNNQLQGSLRDSFYNCSQLVTVDLGHNHFTDRIPKWIGGLFQLTNLLLGYNNFKGDIPIQLCKLENLSLLDLSNNNLSGHIIPCLRTTSVWSRLQESPTYIASAPGSMEQYLEFTTKSRSYHYSRRVLYFISGIDLSCNNFIGEIPPVIGNLSNIQVLNLSHNSLTGPIPSTFSNLNQIESLDLSYNKLSGHIPSELTKLYSLAVFSVAHNNLSGKTPKRIAQFATFDKDSYEGNPFLCGLPLSSCTELERNSTDNNIKGDNNFIDMETFYVSFIVSYIIMLIKIVTILFINSYWRSR